MKSRSVQLAASALLAATLGAQQAAAQPHAPNMLRYQQSSGLGTGDFRSEFAADGKLGPENRWIADNRGPRINFFLDQPITVGELRVFTGGYGDPVLGNLTLRYRDASGVMQNVPGGSVSGNSSREIVITFPAVSSTQFEITSSTRNASVLEVVMLPPGGGTPFPIHAGIEPHMARQHRVALTPASSTAPGTRRRSVVDGFVSDQDFWQTNATSGHWIELDLRDPPETDPPRVRTVTAPVEVGSVHLHSGLASGSVAPIARGRMQQWDDAAGAWVTIPGTAFSGNTNPALELMFDAPITTARMRLVIDDTGTSVVREIVPLPPRDSNASWPLGAGVREGERPSFLDFDDRFYSIEAGLSPYTIAEGGVLKARVDDREEHYQVILKVGSDEYWLRNRESGLALAPQGMSTAEGAPVVEEPYSALPHQHWRIDDSAAPVQFINAFSGLALAPAAYADGATLIQSSAGALWSIVERDTNDKKGHGGFPQLAPDTQPAWAYNWGPDDSYPAPVDFWPMQWGTFNWMGHYRVPAWQRADEAIVHMGFNEPDKDNQSDIPVDVALNMWPRLEARDMPLLGPAPVNPTNTWITDFETGAQDMELRVEFQAVHRYPGPNADSFMSVLQDTFNTFGRPIVLSEFSIVDWNDNNGWNKDQVYNFFLEIFWRMELTDHLRQFAVFMFTSDPANPISDNRGEMIDENGDLTPAGEYLAAWDGDTTIRTDTPYYLHNNSLHRRIGVDPGNPGGDAIQVGTRFDRGGDMGWKFIPPSGGASGNLIVASDGRILQLLNGAVSLGDASAAGQPGTLFELNEASHGWFYIDDITGASRLRMVSGSFDLEAVEPSGFTGGQVQWRMVPVFKGLPGPAREAGALGLGGPDVGVTWEHGFRDIEGFDIYRSGPGGGPLELIASGVEGFTFADVVPEVGVYSYGIVAIGDTGAAPMAVTPAIAVETCPADFNADFSLNSDDVVQLIGEVELGFDFDGSSQADMFDLIEYLRVFDAGCE